MPISFHGIGMVGGKPADFTIVEKVRAELPAGFSEAVADKILGGVLAAAQALERMAPK